MGIGTHPTEKTAIGIPNQETELDKKPRTPPSNLDENFTNAQGDLGVYSPQSDFTSKLVAMADDPPLSAASVGASPPDTTSEVSVPGARTEAVTLKFMA